MAELENSSALLKQALDELRKSGMLTKQTLDKLNASAKRTADSTADLDKNTKEAADSLNTFDKKLVSAVKNLTDSAQAIRDNREDFRSLNPAIRTAGVVFGTAGKKLGGFIEGVGEAASGLSTFFGPKGKLIGIIGGGLLSGLGKAIGSSSDAAAQLAVQFGEFATGELQRVVEAYREVGSVGAIGARGMSGLYDQAIAAGLSLGQFSKIVSANGQTLATAFGDTASGAEALADMGKMSEGLTREFYAMGLSLDKARDFQAKFIEINRLTNKVNVNDRVALTEASKQYIYQLDELSRITGLSKDAAAKILDEQMRNLRFRASVRIAERQDPSGKIAENMKNTAAVLKSANRYIGEGFEDIFGGATTQAAIDLQLATGNAAQGIAEQLRQGLITSDQALEQIRQAMVNKATALGGDEFFRRAAKLEHPLNNVATGMDDVIQSQNLNVASLQKARQSAEAARKAGDKNTTEIVDAQVALQKLGTELDKIVRDQVLPNASKAVKEFTETLYNSVKYINEKLGNTSGTGGGGRGGGAPPSRGPGTAQAPVTGAGGAGAPTPEAAGALSAIRNMIGKAESGGDYNVMVGGKKGDLTNMTLAQIYDQQKKMMQRGSGFESSALGKYQMTYGTLRDMANKLGLDPNTTKFDQATQDRLADELIVMRGGYNKYAAGAISKERFLYNLSGIWAGLPMDASGKSRYAGVGSNKATVSWDDAMSSFAQGGITSGPRSGYAAMLHGTEAVVPLPGGRSIPVEMTGMTDKMGEQLDLMNQQVMALNDLVTLMRSNNDTSTKILRAAQN